MDRRAVSGRGGTKPFSSASMSEEMDDDLAGEARSNNSSSRSVALDRADDVHRNAGGTRRSTSAKPSLR